MEGWQWRPRFSILLHSSDGCAPEELINSVRSVERQSYRHWGFAGGADEPIGSRIASVDADYLVPLRAGDELSSTALFRFAEAAQANRPAILYGDEDQIDARGRRSQPWFKPQWNREMFLAMDYLSSAAAIDVNLARGLGGTRDEEDVQGLLLEATAAADGSIIHIPHILCHKRGAERPSIRRIDAVAAHVNALGATCRLSAFDTIKVEWPLPAELPLVTVIVPTRDKLELLRPCVNGVLGRTDYSNFELLIIDNGSIELRTAQYLRDLASHPRVRIVSFPEPYNFSAMNNFGVRHATGSFVCLLNNDTEVVEPAWLTELMRYAVRADVGAVGAKLLYEDGSIQHAGVVVGIGQAAGHAHRFLPAGEPGYFRMAHVSQFVSAVTAACLVIDKGKFHAAGGLDEELAVAFNDVDLCLRIEAAGWRNVYVPHSVLLHHESKTRGSDMSPEQIGRYHREVAILQHRWGTKTYADPLHNPNLDRATETFAFSL